MPDPTNTDLAVQIATLSGKLDGFIASSAAREAALGGRLDESLMDRRALHDQVEVNRKDIEKLKQWRSFLTGLGGAGTLAGLYATARIAGIIH